MKWNVLSIFGSGTGLLIALEFTPSELAFYGILAGLLTALIASVTSIISLLIARQGRAAAVETKVAIDENTKLSDKIIAKADAIGANVDGLKTKDASRIAELEREVLAGRQREIDAEKRAVALAGIPPSTASPQASPDAIVGSLTEINKDTTAIEKNTSSTESKIDDLKNKEPR